jgi:nitrite reductase/ring-hydroxylating ferredoxin subunit
MGKDLMVASSHARNEPDPRRIGMHPDLLYPLAIAKYLKPGRTIGTAFAGEPIVLARTQSGKVFALEDRCPHRQVPLSLGVVTGERLRCCYHAWSYHAAGLCVAVPYLAKDTELPRGVRSYPCREAYGLIFVFPGDPLKTPLVPFPEIPHWANREYRTMYFSRDVKCHYSFMHENLMDMNHQFLHRRVMGNVRVMTLDVRMGPGWLEVDYRLARVAGRRHRGADLLISRLAGAGGGDYDVMTIATRYPYQTLKVRRAGSQTALFDMWAAYVPADREQRINCSFGLLMIRKPPLPGLLYLMWPVIRHFVEAGFAEDRLAMEAEQRAHDLQGADWNQEIYPLVRELKELLIRQGAPLHKESSAHRCGAG